MFKEHPNKKAIKFVVIPTIKEVLESTYDAMGSYDRLRETIDPLLREHQLNFDFSLTHAYGVDDISSFGVVASLEMQQEIYEGLDLSSERH